MRGHIFAILAALTVIFPLPQTGLAQGAPYGSYQQTCRDIRTNGDRIFANCQRVDGGWNDTSLDFRSCRGEVINDNGNLRCGGGGYDNRGYDNRGYYAQGNGRWAGGLPPGDYKRTCRNMYMNGDRLSATCQRVDGGWKNTSLKHVQNCQSMIVNDNGNLRCGGR